MTDEFLGVENVVTVADSEVHVLAGYLVEGLQERQGDFSWSQMQRAEKSNLPQPLSDLVVAVVAEAQTPPGHEFTDQSVGGNQGQPCAAGNLRQ